jgi:hypothetical protein
MNTDELHRAYDEFLSTAKRGEFDKPHDGTWSAEMVLAHVIVGDRLIAEAAGRIMDGGTEQFDNAASQSEPYLEAVIEAAGGWDGLIASVERGGAELMALAHRMSDEQGSAPIAVRIVSDGAVVLDASVPVSSLIRAPADTHLRMHAQQLAALAVANGQEKVMAPTTGHHSKQ